MGKSKLGKGLDILMPADLDRSILEEDKNRVQKLLIQDIIPNPEQPRREFDDSALGQLAASVKRHGILQPIIVTRYQGRYMIVAGERRWRAAQQAELTHVPAIVRTLKELEQVELSLIENIQRVDLSPLEQALSVYRLQHQFNLNTEQIAKRLGKAATTISNLTRLLQLPDEAREALRQKEITEGHARSILSLKGYPEKQKELLNCIKDNRWSVRQAEQFAVKFKNGLKNKQTRPDAEIASNLSKKLDTKIEIKRKAKGGQIVISFSSDEQLNRIIKRL